MALINNNRANRSYRNTFRTGAQGWIGEGTGGTHLTIQNNYFGSIWSQVRNCCCNNLGISSYSCGYNNFCGSLNSMWNYGCNLWGGFINTCGCCCNNIWNNFKCMLGYGLGMGAITGLFNGISYGINIALYGRQNAERVHSTSKHKVTKKEEEKESSSLSLADRKSKVTELLNKNNIKLDDKSIEDIAEKYKSILQFNKKETTEQIDTRLLNYAKALQRQAQESQLIENESGSIELTKVQEAIDTGKANGATDEQKTKAQQDIKNAFYQYGKEDIELGDTNGDGSLDIEELFKLAQKQSGKALTDEEKEVIRTRLAALDRNNNKKIDYDEQAAYLWTMSNATATNDPSTQSSGSITYEEWTTAEEGIIAEEASPFRIKFKTVYNETFKIKTE